MRTIPLSGAKAEGRVALIDDADYELVSQYRWKPEQRREGAATYARCKRSAVDGGTVIIKMHQLITGWPLTDHIDHDGLNNQRANLRPATHSQNHANQRHRTDGTSQFKGVLWRRGTWQAVIRVDYRQRFLGSFTCEEDAARAYDAAAREAFGEYALTNFHYQCHPPAATTAAAAPPAAPVAVTTTQARTRS